MKSRHSEASYYVDATTGAATSEAGVVQIHPGTVGADSIVPRDEFIFVASGIELTAKGGDLYFTVDSTLNGVAVPVQNTTSYYKYDSLTDAVVAGVASDYTGGNGYAVTTNWTPRDLSSVDSITAVAGQFLGENEITLADDNGVLSGVTVYNVDAARATGVTLTYDATILVAFDADDTTLQNATLNLSDAAINVTQVIPDPSYTP